MSGAATFRGIPEAVASRFGVTVGELLSARRDRAVARPRQIAMWLCWRIELHTLSEIGRHFDRDHTTVMAAIRRVDALMAADPALSAAVWDLAAVINPDEAASLRRVA